MKKIQGWIFRIKLIAIIVGLGAYVFYGIMPMDTEREARLCFDLINEERVRVGVQKLTWDSGLEDSARQWNETMLAKRAISHSHKAWTSENVAMLTRVTFSQNVGRKFYEIWEHSVRGHYTNYVDERLKKGAIVIQSQMEWRVIAEFGFLPIVGFVRVYYATYQATTENTP